jgi:uncharacterized protein (DUF433 family)
VGSHPDKTEKRDKEGEVIKDKNGNPEIEYIAVASQTKFAKIRQKKHDNAIVNYQSIITIEPGKREGRPCIRRMRIAVADVLGWLAAGMSHGEILGDYPELTEDDIRACLAYAAVV